MTDTPDPDRADLRHLVYHSIGGNWLTRPLTNAPLHLGPDFARAARRTRESVTQLLGVMANQLDPMLGGEGRAQFLRTGHPRTEAAKGAVALFRPWMQNIVAAAPPWVRLVFATPDAVADYAIWAKTPCLTANEAFLLSVGLSPLAAFTAKLHADAPGADHPDATEIWLATRHQIFGRVIDQGDEDRGYTASEILAAIDRAGHDVTPGFRAMLETMPNHASVEEQGTTTDPDKVDRREFNVIAQLVTALAIKAFNFDPQARRSDVPRRIADLTAHLGMPLSEATVRKYLKAGSERISPEALKK